MKPIVLFPALCVFLVLAASPAAGNDYGLCFGNGGTIITPPLKMPAGLQRLTVACRFKALALPPRQVSLVSQSAAEAEPADKGLFRMDLTPRGQIAFTLHGAKGQPETVTGKTACDVERWHHAAAAWDGTELTLYLDGKAAGSRRLIGLTLPAGVGLPLVIGPAAGKNGSKQADYQGFIAEVAVWSTARNAEAVAQDAGRSLAGNEAGLAALFSLRETAPTDVVRDKVSGARRRFPPCWSARAGAACPCGISLSPPGPSCTSSPTTCLRRRAVAGAPERFCRC